MNQITQHKGADVYHVVGTTAHEIAHSYRTAERYHERNGGLTRSVRERLNRERKACETGLDIVDAEVVDPTPPAVDLDAIVAAKAADETAADVAAATNDEPLAAVIDINRNADAELTPAKIAAMDRHVRLATAKDEARQVKAAEAMGRERPPTPVLDWMEANPVATRKNSRAQTAQTASAGGRRGGVLPEFLIDGKVMSMKTRPFTLTYLAEKVDHKKGTTKAFRQMLVDAGIADPDHSAWTFTTEDGRVLEARLSDTAAAS